MVRFQSSYLLGLAVVLVSMAVGCGSDKPSAPLAAFSPEIVNNTDNFSFQATDTRNVTTTVQYTWSNSGNQATIDHSSALSSGIASIVLLDANGTEVYQSGLLASGTPSSLVGVAGDWTIRVTLSHCYGTLNFRVQKQ